MPLRCSLSLDITNALKVPGPTLVAKQKSTSAPDSVTSHDFMADFPDIVLLPTPEDVNVPAALVQNSVPITATAPDTNVTVFSDAPSGLACSCAHEPFPASTPNSQNNELSKVTTPETAVDPGTVPCSRPGPPQFPFSVGLKLNLLDLTLAIDLQYLGVCLPIPPPVLLPGASPGNSASSCIRFVSRTGKTTDFTKIKGWREKFTTSGSSSFPGVSTSLDTGQKNLSAFCSDMLDEYLESEGKLIDERADSFSKAAVSPVAYQMPTKSTSYVRTLDSVLKKQVPTTITHIKPYSASQKSTLASKSKLGENTSKKSSRPVTEKTASSTDKPLSMSHIEASKLGSSLSKSARCGTSKTSSSELSAAVNLSQSKKSVKIKSKKGSKTSQAAVDGISQGSISASPGSSTVGGRSAGLPKTLVKLMDVEDGAVWEGKHRTCITEERAAIALSSLVTVEAAMTGTPSTVIKRRAPPCLNDFCRLGCVCGSLAQERRQHHCGKPQCMLGCDCLRRKVVLLKTPAEDESPKEGPEPEGQLAENGVKVKKRKRRKTYKMEEGELRPPSLLGPTKRLEIVSRCKWATAGSRNIVLSVVCEHMAQDRLNSPFWIGKYRIEPVTKTVQETEEGSTITYKVVISEPHLVDSKVRKEEDERVKQLEALLIKTIGKSEVKGLPLLSQVTPAGVLKAETKLPGVPGQIWVNGKPYPQAKLELGQMGALHPANRLAAYITGRVYTAKQQASNIAATATISKMSHTTNPTTTTTSVAVTTSVTNTLSPTVITVMPTDGSIPVTKAVPRSGSAAPEKKTFVLGASGPCAAQPAGEIRLMQPIVSTRPAVPGQRMVFQMLKTSNGNTLYRNPNGQLIQLVPLSQFRALNPNLLIPKQTALIRLPTPTPVPLSKPVNVSSTSSTITPSTTVTSTTQDQSLTPVHSTTTVTMTTTITSSVAAKQVISLSGSKSLEFSSQPNAVKIVPGFLHNIDTSTLRIVPQKIVQDPKVVKDPKITITTSATPDQNSSDVSPTNRGFVLLTPQTTQSQVLQGSNSTGHTFATPSRGTERDSKPSQCLSESPDKAIHADHSYTFETKECGSSPQMVGDAPKEGSDPANISGSHMLLKEVLALGPIETGEGSVTTGAIVVNEDGCKTGSVLEDGEIDSDCTELTEDSDMYDDTESARSSDQEDLCIVTDSNEGEKNMPQKRVFVDAEFQHLTEKDEEELVDIETLDERPERSSSLAELKQHEGHPNHKAKVESGDESPAQDEIESLTKKRNQLVKVQKKLRKKRVYFLQVASQLTGKSEESISQKLDEIVAKQKALESQNKAKGTNPDFIEQLIDSEEMGLGAKKKLEFEEKMKDSISIHAHLSSNSKPIDLSITKQKTLVFQDKGKDNDSVEQKTLEADDKGAQAFPRPCQPDKMLGLDTPHLGNSLPASRERTRPNILARSKSQMPPVSPVKDQGVASVSISVPAVSHPIRVENPFPILQSQVLKITNSPLKINTPVKPISLPRISGVVSLVPPEKVIPPSLVLQKTDATAVSQGRAGFRPAVLEPLQSHSSNVVPSFQEGQGADRQQEGIVPKQPEQGTKVNITDAATSRKEEGKNTAGSNEPDDENLMSLLDELVFLNQQLNNESTQPEGGALNLTEAGEVPADLLTEKEAGVDVDDERSLSPLFLRLDEDLIASTTSKGDEIDDIPPKVDDLVKVIFGSDSPPNSSESEVVAVVSDGVSIGLVGPAKHDAPSLPPLLQMKAGGITIGDSLKEQASVAWRPMPKLAPLGLKTQEAGPPNAMNSVAVKPGSKLPSLQSANT
ncbi:hypothetical protein P4O66_001680 [Electrophorus voltai]|uniref:MGA conserved domain-containing protein n=1 Tax=Electrophorus voltai TaxID=2609070 RepID=A0AAD9DVA9_9TELE|nr:hypothetical protein P4O66_001680 [Electrophorus voltai]